MEHWLLSILRCGNYHFSLLHLSVFMDLMICIAITVSTSAAGVRKFGLVSSCGIVLLYQKEKIYLSADGFLFLIKKKIQEN